MFSDLTFQEQIELMIAENEELSQDWLKAYNHAKDADISDFDDEKKAEHEEYTEGCFDEYHKHVFIQDCLEIVWGMWEQMVKTHQELNSPENDPVLVMDDFLCELIKLYEFDEKHPVTFHNVTEKHASDC